VFLFVEMDNEKEPKHVMTSLKTILDATQIAHQVFLAIHVRLLLQVFALKLVETWF